MDELSLFNKEELILEESRAFLQQRSQELDRTCRMVDAVDCERYEEMRGLVKSYGKLLDDYARLFRQSSRLVHMSDRLQRRINETNGALMASQEQLEVRNRFIRNTFGRYLSDEVVASLLDSPNGLELGGEKREVTIMMSDLRGFTSLCEHLAAETVVTLLNLYFEVMVETVARFKGTIMGIIGDGLMVIFGAPLTMADHARRAVACALEMQKAMTVVNERNRQQGLPANLTMGIGINTGMVVVGNIGSEKRSKYSVIGRHVNLASRIESHTVGGQVLISGSTLTACGQEWLRVDGEMTVHFKGVRQAIPLFLVGAMHGAYTVALPEPEWVLALLAEPVPVRFVVVEGKQVTGSCLHGRIVALGKGALELESGTELDRLDNLKLIWSSGGGEEEQNAYGKIIGQAEAGATIYRVVLTAISQEAEEGLSMMHTGQGERQ